jgi:hypothetical protein
MSDKQFHIDRTITFGLIFAVLVQTAGALIWAGAAEARLASLEIVAAHDLPITERLVRLEEQMIGAQQSLNRIESRLDSEND